MDFLLALLYIPNNVYGNNLSLDTIKKIDNAYDYHYLIIKKEVQILSTENIDRPVKTIKFSATISVALNGAHPRGGRFPDYFGGNCCPTFSILFNPFLDL